MNKPTREELEIFLVDVDGQFIPYKGLIVDLVQAHLSKEEELEVVELEKHTMCEAWEKQNKIIEQLKAENQELKRKGEQLCCRVGVLEMENQELKVNTSSVKPSIFKH